MPRRAAIQEIEPRACDCCGQKRTLRPILAMSAIPPSADKPEAVGLSAKCQQRTVGTREQVSTLDNSQTWPRRLKQPHTGTALVSGLGGMLSMRNSIIAFIAYVGVAVFSPSRAMAQEKSIVIASTTSTKIRVCTNICCRFSLG